MKLQNNVDLAKEMLTRRVRETQDILNYIESLEEMNMKLQEELSKYKKFEQHVFPVVSAHIISNGKLELSVDSSILVDTDIMHQIRNQNLVIESVDDIGRDRLKFVIKQEVDKNNEKRVEKGEEPRT